jgi:hypothetical protein
MSERGIRSAAELHRRLEPYGIDITRPRLSRIVKELPARLNTQVLHALLVELQCTADELFRVQEIAPVTPEVAAPGSAVSEPITPPAPRRSPPKAKPAAPRARALLAPVVTVAPAGAPSEAGTTKVPANVLGPSVASLASRRDLNKR